MKRIIWTVVFFVVYALAASVWGILRNSLEAAAAVNQVKDSVMEYTFGQQMARGNVVPATMLLLLFLALLLL